MYSIIRCLEPGIIANTPLLKKKKTIRPGQALVRKSLREGENLNFDES
jgi:hypothetical protein